MSERLPYRLITGPHDATFCRRISYLLQQGYELYGSPALTFDGTQVIAAQAVVLPAYRSKMMSADFGRTLPYAQS